MKRMDHATTFVPAIEPAAQVREPTSTTRSVWARALENMLAGVGAGLAFAALVYVAWGAAYQLTWTADPWPSLAWTWFSALLIALLFGGVLTAIRFGLDEVLEGWDWAYTQKRMTDQDATIAELHSQLDTAKQDAIRLRSELVMATKYGGKESQFVPATGPVEQSVADAKTLLEREYRGSAWSRDAMKGAGWTKTQWEAARNTLVAARVIAYAGKNPQRVASTYELACASLERWRLDMIKAESTTDDGTTHLVDDDMDDVQGGGGERNPWQPTRSS